MTRVRGGQIRHKRHKKILAASKGYRGTKGRLLKTAKEAIAHAGEYAFAHRKQKKRRKRSTWIVKLNAVLKTQGTSYSQFIKALGKSNIVVDRKILADIATTDPNTFSALLEKLNH